jgi:8-oxo-dGTP pyrophosphatase MutT (NUDIX family)
MSWPPHITVAAIVPRNDHFLMVKETNNQAEVYNQPAGHLEPNENLLQATRREVQEETGWLVKPTALIGIYQYHSGWDNILYFRFTFLAEPVEQISHQLDPDIISCHWLRMEDIVTSPLRSPLVATCLQDYLKGQHFPLSAYSEVKQP